MVQTKFGKNFNPKKIYFIDQVNKNKKLFAIVHEEYLSFFEISKNENKFKIEKTNSITFDKNNLIECINQVIFDSVYYLAVSSCDNKIHIYQMEFSEDENNFTNLKFLNSLLGHENKIKSMSHILKNDKMILASSSLDNLIRLWSFQSTSNLEDINQKNKYLYYLNDKHFICLESVLFGHSLGVTSVEFFRDPHNQSISFK